MKSDYTDLQRRGQSIVEYLLIFVVIAAVTVFATGFLPKTRQTLEDHFKTAVQRITKP